MEKKQSSIDYFFEEVVKWQMKPWLYASDGLEPIIKQAKAMHKEEMRDLYLSHVAKAERLRKIFEKQFEELYNETFGGEKE